MKQRIGALLSIVLGVALIVTGTTSGSTVGASFIFGGQVPLVVAVPNCPTGHIVITKDVTGSGTRPVGGWHFTIDSTNCDLFPGSSADVTIPAGGGTVSSDPLYATTEIATDGTPGTLCDYTVTETAVTGWTTTYSPTGPYHLGTAQSGNNDVAVTVTNTSPTITTPPPTTSTAVTTTVVAAPSSTEALANTGTKYMKPATIAGVLLVLLGLGLLVAGRTKKGRRAQS